MLFLTGCFSSMAMMGTGVSNGKLLQSSLQSAASYAVKKQSGKTPIEHALTYMEKNNPNGKKEKCVSFLENTNHEICTIAKKKVALLQKKIHKNYNIKNFSNINN